MSLLTWLFTIYFLNCILLGANSQSFCKRDRDCDDPDGYFMTRCVNNECIVCSQYDYKRKSSKCYEIKDTCQVDYHCIIRYKDNYSCVRGQCQCSKGYKLNEEWGCKRKPYYCGDGLGCSTEQDCINEECVCERGKRRDGYFCRRIPNYCDDAKPCGSRKTCVNNQCQCSKAYENKNGDCRSIPGYCDFDMPCDPLASCVKNRCQCVKAYELINERCKPIKGYCFGGQDCSSKKCDSSTNKCVCDPDFYLDYYDCYPTSMRVFKICAAVIVPLLFLVIVAWCCYKKRKRRNRASSHDSIESVHMPPSSTVPLQTTTSFPEPQSAIHPSAPPADFNEVVDPPPSYDSVVKVKQ